MKKQHIFLIVLTCILMIQGLSARILTASGPVKVNEHRMKNFRKIVVEGQFSVFLVQDQKHEVIVETYQNIMPHVEVVEKNGILTVRMERRYHMIRWRGKKNVLNLYISAKHPEIIKLSGAVDLKADSNIDVKEFTMLLSGASDVLLKRVRSKIVKLYASGACDIDADMFEAENVIIDNSGSCELSTFLNAEWLELDISGSSDFNLAGRADYVDIDASGAGNIDAFELAAQTLKYDASGSGYCGITVEKTIDADISGAASLFYRGNAQITSMDVSGMGSVKKR